jgi:UDP-glucose 4-epimerase
MNTEQSKTILVTGGAGFIGTNLCKRFAAQGKRVISLDNYFTGLKSNHVPGVEYRECHTKDIEKHIHETADIVFHLGEYSRVEQSVHEPHLVWDLNMTGTFAVAEYCRKKNVRLIYAGSSTKFSDGGLGRDQSPYAFTKATNTELIRNYGIWFGLSYAITYFYNVYGPYERSGTYGSLIEIFKQKYLSNEPLTVVSPGTQQRIFTHVDDIIDGLILVGENGDGDNFGLGAQNTYSVLDIAKMFKAPIQMLPERVGNRRSAVLDTTKSRALGWAAKHDIADYIQDIIAQGSET